MRGLGLGEALLERVRRQGHMLGPMPGLVRDQMVVVVMEVDTEEATEVVMEGEVMHAT